MSMWISTTPTDMKRLIEKIKNFFKKEEKEDITLCPVCGKHHFSEPNSYEICPICGWEDDRSQREDPDLRGGANKMSLNEAIAAYREEEDA